MNFFFSIRTKITAIYKMPGTTSPNPPNQSELSADLLQDENYADLNINEILKDMDKAEGALNELDGRLDNLNAKIDALLKEQTPKSGNTEGTKSEEKSEEKK